MGDPNLQKAELRASYKVAWEIGKTSHPFSDGVYIKNCAKAMVEELCPEKMASFERICLSRQTVTRRINELSEDIAQQLKEKAKNFVCFSIALDESNDITDTAQLVIFY